MHRPGLLLLLGLVLALVVWIAWPGTPDDKVRLTADEERRGSRSASLHANDSESCAQKPALVGRDEEKTREPERGDVQILVVGRHGQPLPNVGLDVDVPVHLALVDAETGRTGPRGRWNFVDPDSGVDCSPECEDTRAQTLRRYSGAPQSVELTVDLAGDGIALEGGCYGFCVSERARSLYIRYPVRPEAEVYAHVVGSDGATVGNACAYLIRRGNGLFQCSEPTRGGLLRLRGIPFYRNVRLSLAAAGPGVLDDLVGVSVSGDSRTILAARLAAGACILQGDLPGSPDSSLTLGARMPRDQAFTLTTLPVLVGRSRLSNLLDFAQWVFMKECARVGEAHGAWKPGRPQEGTRVTAHARRRDGSVYANSAVRVEGPFHSEKEWFLTDEDGQVSLVGVAPGRYRFQLFEPGTVGTTVDVVTSPGGNVKVVLQEGPGGGLAVRVVDPQGRGLPFVRISFGELRWSSPICWEDEAKAIQRIDPFSDHVGYRLYERLTPGTLTVKALWADRAGEAKVEVIEGVTTDVKIVLHPPK